MSHFIDSMTVEGLLTHKSWNVGTLNTVVSAGTITLLNSSESTQIFTGNTSGQILKMPDATTFGAIGQRYIIVNDSSQLITVQDNAGGALFTLNANYRAFVICNGIGTAAGSWTYFIVAKYEAGTDQFTVVYPGSGLAVNYSGGNAHFNGNIYVVAGGTLTLPASTTNGWIYVDINGTVKSGASLPVNTMPLYQFTTSVGAVTTLTDERMDYEQNLVWGVLADISNITYNATKSPGILEKYARADHTHGVNLPLYKAGSVAAGTFAGSPQKTATITFGTVFPSTSYSVTITGSDGRSWIATNLTTTGFTINTQANQALTGPVYWQATLIGESV